MTGKELRIVFMGTPEFAVASLDVLVANGYNVVGVITAPDKPAGRGQKLSQSAVKIYAMNHDIPVLQPEKLKDPDFHEALKKWQADLQVVVAFRMLPEVVWDMPPYGTFNLHGSLLPKYRGAAPLNWAVINGDTESGVTTFKLQQEIDTGNIIFQEKTEIGPDDNVEVLHDKLMELGSHLVLKTVNAIAEGNIQMIPQEDLVAKGYLPTPAPKIFREDCLIDWTKTGSEIKNKIRGLSPYPTAWTNLIPFVEGKPTNAKIFQVEYENGISTPGKVYTDNKTFLKIGCGDGWINIKELQLAGKKRMMVDEFLRGFQNIDQFTALHQI